MRLHRAIRSVGGATESKREDLQAGFERMGTLLPAVLAGVNYITCGGTLDSTHQFGLNFAWGGEAQ